MNAPSNIKGVLDAVIKVLQDSAKPLHYKEITKRILSQGLWTTKGKTPSATVNAQLAMAIKRDGVTSIFNRTGRGIFTLNQDRVEPAAASKSVKSEERALYVRGPGKGKTLSFTESALRILEAANAPMHYRDITRHALEHNLLNTEGKTPEATMYAQILQEVQRRQRRGDQQRFSFLGKGIITLLRSEPKGLEYQVEEANRKVRSTLLERIKKMPPGDFEELIGQLLAAIGFADVEVTSRSKDGGIDVRGTLVVGDVISTRLAVQVKRWKNNVQAPVIQQVRGSLGAHEQGLVITTSGFSKGAIEEAARPDATPVGLMDGEQLMVLLTSNDIGARRTSLELLHPEESNLATANEEPM